MRFLRALIAPAVLLTSGCGYVHFGRLPEPTAHDATLNTAYSNLSTDYKILKQELALVRKEGDALRAAIDGRGAANPASELVARLNETTRELAALRASHATLRESRAPSAANTLELEDKLAVSLRNYTQLQEENSRLRGEVDRTRTENVALAAQVRTITAQNTKAQAALAQLNTELLAQKEARGRAEQQAAATAAQLSAVIAGANARPSTLAEARETTARASTALAVPAEGSPTAELRTSAVRVEAAPPAAPAEAPRIHIVTATDTLEKIAVRYYGDPSRWRTLYFANNALLSGGRPLTPGMQLEIPKD